MASAHILPITVAPNLEPTLQWLLRTVSAIIDLQYCLSNTLIAPSHPAAHNDAPPPALLEFHPSSNPVPPPDYFANSMIGRALLEWNSSVGIPLDAWTTVISARVYCAGCNRIRSFDGDCLHRDAEGNAYCGGRRLGIGEGDEEHPVFGKGKGRAH